ncbi:SusC/RagA family TonB-linked outer membrane protein [Hallella bergensis]|uniref:SusC/RagA family TonB-linked outer membrane protein n=1 Tax=Hallella bergensis TaxID=242750 RepID=UPI00399044F8
MKKLFVVLLLTNFSLMAAFAQNIQVQGIVTGGSNSEPLLGVSVVQEGKNSNGVVTDIDGKYTITVPDNASLTFSYVGFLPQTVKVNGRKTIDIELREDPRSLEEVVVIGYGVQKKVDLSGSVTAVDGREIASRPVSNVTAALQGLMPGVTILRSSGQPGSETSGMRIRGFSSVNTTSTLVLIDGIEGDMNLLNPNDIESISVLKDAASAAIYGARAAAGVVLITTKSGTQGKTHVSYDGYYSFNTPGNMPERLPAWEEQEFINLSRLNATGKAEWNEEKSSWVGNPNFNYRPLANGRWDLFEATNWVDEGTKNTTHQMSHSISVNGGTKTLSYLVSGNIFTKDGLLKFGPDNNRRTNLHAKINAHLNKYIDLGVNLQYQDTKTEQNSNGSTAMFYRLFSSRGRQPIFNPESNEKGFYGGDQSGNIYNGDLQVNPIDIMLNGGKATSRYQAYIGKANLTLKNFVKGLRINLSASRRAGYYSYAKNTRTLYWKDRMGKGVRYNYGVPNELYKSKNNDYHDLLEATANYDLNITKQHHLTLLAGTSYENYRKDEIGATAKNMISNDFYSFNFYDTSEATNTSISDNIQPWSMMSYFARLNYNFMERYLFEANVRYDGSSRLAPSKRWKAFPSVSAAWRISEEKWFENDIMNNLKIRASWGQLGNGAVLGLYDYIPLINSGGSNTYMGEKYFYQGSMASTDKTWEVISTTNLGVDFGFLNNRLFGTFEYYWKTNDDMLSSLQLPHQIGINVPKVNVGKLKTWGWDFNIGWRDKIGQVSYQLGFNISDSQNKLMEYDGASTIGEGTIKLLEGYELNSIWGYKTNGYWSSREEYEQFKKDHPGYKSFNDGKVAGGDVKYVAQGDPDHQIGVGGATPEDHGDLVYLGNSNARYTYAFNIGLQWKGFDFSMLFQGVGKRNIIFQPSAFAPLYQDYEMPWTIHRDYWTEDNPNACWPRIYRYKGNDFNFKPCDKWLQDASYLRLKNVTLGYTLPVMKQYIQNLRIYVTGEDVWEHTNMLKVFDPEVGNNSNRYIYPFFRSWTVGVNITL